MPVFGDSENMQMSVPEGDYVFCVVGFEAGLSKGGKTSGCDKYELELEIEGQKLKVYENLIDHESCAWKIDTFLKSCGIKLAKGEAFEFRQDLANARGIRWVDPRGLRGWCRLFIDEYQGKKRNKVAVFYTEKEKLTARPMPQDETEIPF